MKARLWVKYFFKDNRRFLVCARFYSNFALINAINTKAGKAILKRMPKRFVNWYTLKQLYVIKDTLEFKTERKDKL